MWDLLDNVIGVLKCLNCLTMLSLYRNRIHNESCVIPNAKEYDVPASE